jgi:hypothetical protein
MNYISIRTIRTLVKWSVLAAGGLLALVIVLGVGGVQVPWPPTETTQQQKPSVPLKPGQRIRIVSAWRRFLFARIRALLRRLGSRRGAAEGIEITMAVNSDGVPDRRIYEPIAE